MTRSLVLLLMSFHLNALTLPGQDQRPGKRLRLSEDPPTYVHNKNYNQKCFHAIKKGIDRTRDYLGNYGPVQVYVIGQETDELKDPAITRAIIKAYCRRRNLDHPERISSCLEGKGASLIERARKGSTEAYLSYVPDATSPFAELIFINPHGFPFPYLHTRGIHEYTHVFQRAFPATPTWMTEGGAEFLAFYLGDQHEWVDMKQSMNQSMRMVQSVKEAVTMKDFEDIEKVEKERPEWKKYYRHLAYDAGVWAVAFAIYRSKSQSVKSYPQEFYPLIARVGWQKALSRYANVRDSDAFYAQFQSFLSEPIGRQMKILDALQP